MSLTGKSTDIDDIKNKELVQLLDEKNKLYSIYLSPENARLAKTDIYFAQSLLDGVIREEERNSRGNEENFAQSETINMANDNAEKAKVIWTPQQMLLLISLYHQQQENMKNGKMPLRTMWKRISEKMMKKGYNISPKQCSIKMDTLKRRYKKVFDHNKRSGNDMMKFEYFDELDAIFRKQPWIKPEVVASSELHDSDFEQLNERDSINATENMPSNTELIKKHRKIQLAEDNLEEKRLKRQLMEAYRERKLMLLEKLVDHLTQTK